ncbi:phage portal protein [Streptococcus macedonicus]|uniref:Phage portal protein n=1 Tax=Streptococcus macedonicus TaxID=59310 RepID=A0AAP8FZ17_STRMC|nr:phage portal protein [Streptococcus macedonicus]PHV57662.1 phage portal protein [Streptococcus macedonicus]
MSQVNLNKRKLFTTSVEEVTEDLVSEAVALHQSHLLKGYIENEDMYMSQHKILRQSQKEPWKPDNRLVINYAKYIVDTFSGYQIGVPVKVTHDNEEVTEFINDFRKLNDMEDTEFELAKMSDIFGHAFLYVYQDELGNTRTTYNSPINMFIVHDNTIEEKPLFAVRYAFNEGEVTGYGQVITDREVIDATFQLGGGVRFRERNNHLYGKLPVVELIENEERQGIFESVKTLINALNKAASEKANDVDYFADAYLKIVGVELKEDMATQIRENRIFNLWKNGSDGALPDVGFLEKPNSDTTQENLIALLKESIFAVSMVANLSEEDFGNASGTALAFKLQAMDNLAKMKDRKMQSALNRLYEIVFNVPMATVPNDGWTGIKYKFTRNVPRNTLEEAQVVSQLSGQVSNETKLSVLSIVDNPKQEIDKMKKEEESSSLLSRKMAQNERFADTDLRDDSKEVIADGE